MLRLERILQSQEQIRPKGTLPPPELRVENRVKERDSKSLLLA